MMQYRAVRGGLLALAAMTGGLAASQASANVVCDRGYVSDVIYSGSITATKAPANNIRILYRVDPAGFVPGNQDPGARILVEGKYYSELYRDYNPADSAQVNSAKDVDYEGKVQMLLSAFLSRIPVRIYSFNTTCSMSAAQMEILLCSAESSCTI